MRVRVIFLNAIVAAVLLFWPAYAQDQGQSDVDELLEQLAQPDQERWQRLERQIVREWSRSGSASADMLLQRGRAALQRGNTRAAIEHLTALTDHAPDFAEGWNTRATAFYMAGRLGESLSDIERTLALNPKHFGAMIGLGQILERLEQPERAVEVFEAAQSIHPHRRDIKAALERLELKLQGTTL